MTIGPAPMIRMLLRSLRFGIVHQLREAIEQITDVMRAGAGLGMTLETKRRPIHSAQALEGTVEQRNMRRPQILAQRGRVDCEAMVLAGDHYPSGIQVLHRMVGAMVAE